MSNYNRKVTSEFLAEKYIEFFRDNLDWKLKKFQSSVLRELGVHVSYMKCWLARARAKLIIYGNGSDQYAHVWDYAAAIIKHNRGSSAFVVCDSIERPTPIFKRMYICLAVCKEGFSKGCRPIIGVDGCHLKRAYPGICLVAVGLDGNNNIYPIAWAVVEVENRDSWTWFLELLSSDLEEVGGEGLTYISDRQKGLLDALNMAVPKAHVRYCARHIWANFKINFSGRLFKETFWNAARAATKAEFDIEMEAMRSLSTQAWEYLNAIPPRHWSRHAFDTNCKSNLLLNNLCEVFNAVLKEARDKPILTHMEWMRRYVMERICQKRQGGMAYEERLMPYATIYIAWAKEEGRFCKWSRSDMGVYEVIYKGEQCAVNLNLRTCTCFHWDLSGLPCPHATCCILLERKDPVDYVHEAYSKARYQVTYEPAALPIPGVKHWEKTGLPEPLPPPMRTMSGRPKSKKRRKEAGEDAEQRVKRVKKPNKCGKCGELGHSKRTCKNSVAPPVNERAPGGRPLSRSQWVKEGREKRKSRLTAREAWERQHGAAASAASSQAGPSNRAAAAAAASFQTGTSNMPPSAARTITSFTELLSQASNNLL
ncbi:uncharacterized protein LOC141602566 [Silene latifolia]|uniref:uncharacterized protein LOC141602566 n=1 Tax=Silene latifolia TaxID=37657 RepID=UPI003D77A0CF